MTSNPGSRRTLGAIIVLVLTAVLGTALVTGNAQAQGKNPIVSVAAHHQAKAGGARWQGAFVYTPTVGQSGVFFHYGCPATYIARSGGFSPNSAAQSTIKLVGTGPRLDLGAANYTEWFWTLLWPGGAPAGSTVTFDVHCTKAPA